jgi:hypothetical protein
LIEVEIGIGPSQCVQRQLAESQTQVVSLTLVLGQRRIGAPRWAIPRQRLLAIEPRVDQVGDAAMA